MDSLLHRVVERAPLEHEGFSGASLDRAVMADGGHLILKRVARDQDWLMRATHDEGRVATVWSSGLLGRIPAVVEHAVVGVEPDGDGWLVFMRDVSHALFPEARMLSRAESRRILAAAATLHEAFWEQRPAGLCSLADRYATLSPSTAAREEGRSLVVPDLLRPGWETFADVVPPDVAEGVLAILERPEVLAEQLEARPCTIIHGDLKLANLGLLPQQVVMLDWGSWTGVAPPAVEVAWYLAVNASRIDASREEIIGDFRRLSGDRMDETALRLALVGGLVQLGWNKAVDASQHPDEAVQARERADLDWWVARTREGFETWYPE